MTNVSKSFPVHSFQARQTCHFTNVFQPMRMLGLRTFSRVWALEAVIKRAFLKTRNALQHACLPVAFSHLC